MPGGSPCARRPRETVTPKKLTRAPRHRASGSGDGRGVRGGAILALVSETMIPEAFHSSPHFNGLLLVVGFVALLILLVTHSSFL